MGVLKDPLLAVTFHFPVNKQLTDEIFDALNRELPPQAVEAGQDESQLWIVVRVFIAELFLSIVREDLSSFM